MPNKFQLKMALKGEGVEPETIGFGDLAKFGKYLETALKAAIQGGGKPLPNYDRAVVSLIAIEKGNSSELTLGVNTPGLDAFRSISNAVSSAEYSDIPWSCQEALAHVSRHAIRSGWDVEFFADESLNVKHAIISKDNPVPPPSTATISGPTEVWGYLMKVGGPDADLKAVLRLADDKRLSIAVDVAMTKELGKRLLEEVGIEGEATWRIRGWEMVDFRATRVMEYQPGRQDLGQTFRDLAEASGGRWDGIDPEHYVDDLRSEGGR